MKDLLSYFILKLSINQWKIIYLFFTLSISVIQSSGQTYKINFQDNTVSVPSGYLKDIGEAYGLRSGADQGSGQYSYGWVNVSTGQPVSLTSVAKTRSNTGLDVKLNGLVHMDHPNQNNPRGNWEIAIPNGTYQVVVSVGDPTVGKEAEIHRINAEGINIINNFVPNKISNSLGRFTSGTGTNIVVNDGKLTLSYSGGGLNTKLNYVEITPINLPNLQFASSPNSISLMVGETGTIGNALSTSNGSDPITATLNAKDSATNTDPTYLKVSGNPVTNLNFTSGSEISFEINTTGLSAGTYKAIVTASANGYNNAHIILTIIVASPISLADFKVNFSNGATAAPSGWLKDYGQAYANRGNGQIYGWVDTSPQRNPLNLSIGGTTPGNGRNRPPSPDVDVVNETFMHMQADDVSNFNGTAIEGVWEAQVPNGIYLITVRVGDMTSEATKNTRHKVNAEGINVVDLIATLNAVNDKTGIATVVVADGKLTLDAIGGLNTKIKSVIISPAPINQAPYVVAVNPINNATNVPVNTSISANQLFLPNADNQGLSGVDNSTITSNSVRLYKVNGNVLIPSVANGTGGGDAITLTPSITLENNTTYRFEISNAVKDRAGFAFLPFSSTFTTTSVSNGGGSIDLNSVSFTKIATAVASGAQYTSLAVGPDGKFYGLTIGGDIHRWTINSNGTLANKEVLSAWKTVYGNRSAVGFAFSPNATANNLIAFVSHCSSGLDDAPDWDSKISQLSGTNLETEKLVVTNLPRSLRDHLTNSIAFKTGEPNVLYYNQGSLSAGGAPDAAWGNREESLLSGGTMRLDLDKLPQANWPLDAKTSRNLSVINSISVNSPTTSDGFYNPYYVNAPLTIFASGIRNAYDLVWHSNGQLYVPANGTAGGSNTPASVNGTRRPDGTFYDTNNLNYPVIPASLNNNVQKDWLFRIDPSLPVGYYGHPNPYRGEYVINRGDIDINNSLYNGIQADIRYRGAAYDFDYNKSPNGAIEYKSNTVGGKLKGTLLVVRYSGGDDIIALVPDGANGDITTAKTGIPGFTGFNDPLDLVEDINTGNIYVSEFGSSKITLLRPNNQTSTNPVITLSLNKLVMDDVVDGNPTPAQTVFVSNTGNASLNNISLNITGTNASQFSFNTNGLIHNLAPGQTTSFTILFNPSSVGTKFANLVVSGDSTQAINIALNGLGKQGLGDSNEPSLQWVLDTYLGKDVVNVGDDDASTPIIHSTQATANLLGAELPIQAFQSFTDGPINVQVLSVFENGANNPIVGFGWYNLGDMNAKNGLFTISNTPSTNAQTLSPSISGITEFTTSTSNIFGFYSYWSSYSNRHIYSEDNLNTFSNSIPHQVRVYAVPGESNAYIIAFENNTLNPDYQDIVLIIRNVKPYIVQQGSPKIVVSTQELIFDGVKSTTIGSKTITIQNTGNAPLQIQSISKINNNTNLFTINGNASSINPGASLNLQISFVPGTAVGSFKTDLRITSNDTSQVITSIGLYGLSTNGFEGANEPTLANVLSTLGIGINAGWTSLADGIATNLKGEEVLVQLFQKASSGNVTINPVARYSPQEAIPFGYYTKNNQTPITNQVGVLLNGSPYHQTLFPGLVSGTNQFDPGANAFGIFTLSNVFNRTNYTEDALNVASGVSRRARVYPLKNRQGQLVANSYLICFEDASNGDYQDYMFVISNVIPYQTALNWTKLQDGHIKRKEAQSIAVDNKLYVVGGFYEYIAPYLQITNTMEVYNPNNNTWAYTAPSLRAVSHASIALDELSNGQKELWLIGGFEGNHPGVAIKKVQIYNINTNTWRYGPDLPETMSGHANALLGRKIHVFGGVFADRNTNKDAHYFMDLDNQNLGWQVASPMPQARNHFAGISFQGKIYALGGQNHHDSNNQDVNYAHVYDSYSDTWKKIADLPITRSHFEHDVYVTANEKIVVVGGRTATTTQITNVSEYDPILDTWYELGSLYAKREASNIAIINNTLYVAFGGLNGITPTIDSYSTNFVRTPSNKLGFQAKTIELTMNQNVTLKKYIYLWASNGTPSYTINTNNLPNWLSISNTTGNTLVQSKEIGLNFNTSNLTAGVHTYQIIASANGYSNAVIDITLTVNPLTDTQAPSAPVLSLGGVTQNRVSLNWTNSTDNVGVSTYEVYNENVLIGNTANTNYIVTGLNATTTYNFTVKAKDAANNTSGASNVITSTTSEVAMTYKINFQDNTVSVPSGYLNDIGEAYGVQSASDQGLGLYSYGWVNITTGLPISLTSMARTRSNTGLDTRLNGFIHMNHPTQSNPRGNWEIAVPNGTYQVLVSVGDATVGTASETHRINAEGVNIINNFIPNNVNNSLGRFSSGLANNVVVSDGKLTLTYTGGGVNTKLNYVEITPVGSSSLMKSSNNTKSLKSETKISNQAIEITKVYPNPLSDEGLIRLDLSEKLETKLNYQILDQLGRILQSDDIENEGKDFILISLKGLSSGIYLMKINGNNIKPKLIKILKN